MIHPFPATSEGVLQEATTTDSQQHTTASAAVQQENRGGKNLSLYIVFLLFNIWSLVFKIDLQHGHVAFVAFNTRH